VRWCPPERRLELRDVVTRSTLSLDAQPELFAPVLADG
jgi:hypothetical protein